jgi:hypothetical protein
MPTYRNANLNEPDTDPNTLPDTTKHEDKVRTLVADLSCETGAVMCPRKSQSSARE